MIKRLYLYDRTGPVGVLSHDEVLGWICTPRSTEGLIEQARHYLQSTGIEDPSADEIFDRLNGQGSPYLVIRDYEMNPADRRRLFRLVNNDDVLDEPEPAPEWSR